MWEPFFRAISLTGIACAKQGSLGVQLLHALPRLAGSRSKFQREGRGEQEPQCGGEQVLKSPERCGCLPDGQRDKPNCGKAPVRDRCRSSHAGLIFMNRQELRHGPGGDGSQRAGAEGQSKRPPRLLARSGAAPPTCQAPRVQAVMQNEAKHLDTLPKKTTADTLRCAQVYRPSRRLDERRISHFDFRSSALLIGLGVVLGSAFFQWGGVLRSDQDRYLLAVAVSLSLGHRRRDFPWLPGRAVRGVAVLLPTCLLLQVIPLPVPMLLVISPLDPYNRGRPHSSLRRRGPWIIPRICPRREPRLIALPQVAVWSPS